MTFSLFEYIIEEEKFKIFYDFQKNTIEFGFNEVEQQMITKFGIFSNFEKDAQILFVVNNYQVSSYTSS